MGQSIPGYREEKIAPKLGCFYRQNVSMLNTRGTWFQQVLVLFLVISMTGYNTVQCAPVSSRTSHQSLNRDQRETESTTESFNQFYFKTLFTSATDLYDYVTATEIVTELVEESLDYDTVTSRRTSSHEMEGTPVDTNLQLSGRTISGETENAIERQLLLRSGCKISSNQNNTSLRKRRSFDCVGARVRLVTLSGRFLWINGRNVRAGKMAKEASFVTMTNAGGPTLVRIQDTVTKQYISMDDAGFLSMVSLTKRDLNRNYGPTVWIENASSTTFNYHQVIDGNNWYMHLSAEGVQGVGSYTRDAQFLKVDCD